MGSAPYASKVIPLFLNSLTGLKYRTLSCMECGEDFFERNSDRMVRLGNKNLPSEAHIDSSGKIDCNCGRCNQQYSVTLSLSVVSNSGVPLYMQPQSIYVISEPQKKFRNVYCLECGKAFFSISDRIQQVTDNVTPVNLITGMGAMEARCKFQHCKQSWAIRV